MKFLKEAQGIGLLVKIKKIIIMFCHLHGLNLEAKDYCKLSLVTETFESSQENSDVSISIRHCLKDSLNMKNNTMFHKYATFIAGSKRSRNY